ncbi:MAG: hypothetical protein ABFQ53_03060 [Patescibacteria group bacterium]
MYSGLKTDIRTFTFEEGVEIIPSNGEAKTFEYEALSETEAILGALEEGVGFEDGIQVASERDLMSEEGTNGENYRVNEKFVRLDSQSTSGFIDHYEVESIEKTEDGLYKAKVNIVFGERPEYQLPDGVQLADGANESYFEINPED